MVVDITPLEQSVEYRWLYAGQVASYMGRQFIVVAVPYQVYLLTGSPLLVGLLGMAQFVPLMAMALIGGSIADAVDRRVLLFIGQVSQGITAIGLLVNAAAEAPAVWPLFVLSSINAGVSAIDSPTRTAVLPSLVGRRLLPSAFALNQTMSNVGQAVGPALGGLLIAQAGLPITYATDVGLFVVAGAMMSRIRPLPPEGGGRRPGLESIREGLGYLRRQRMIQAIFAVDVNAMVFGMPRALFPALGTGFFGGNATTVGLLYAAPGAGAFLAAATSGWIGLVRRRGRVVLVAVAVWGAAIAAFGLTPWLAPALVLLAIAGGADVVSAVLRNTMLQLRVPDALRGRLSAIHTGVVAGGPRLGDLEAGAVASVVSVQFSVVSGGVACVLGVLGLARLFPELLGYRGEADEDAP